MPVYYISPNGDDSKNGNSKDTAWKTCEKVNCSNFFPGDRIRFERGGKWNETLIPPSSGSADNPIVFECYGMGAAPIITGEIEVTEWVNEGNSIYSKVNADFSNIHLLTIDGKTREKGRFPKKSYLITTSAAGNTSVTAKSMDIPTSINFKGGEIVVTKNSWVQDRGIITGHSGNTMTYSGTSKYPANEGWGFFVQNHPNCLSEFGDWWFDGSEKKLYMHFGKEYPSAHVVKVATRMTVVDIKRINYLRFENIDILYGHRQCVALTNAKFNTFKCCNVRYAGSQGFQHYDLAGFSDGTTIDGCTIQDTFNNAIKATNNFNITIRNCAISRNYIHPGTAGNGDGNGSTIALGIDNYRGGKYTVEDNLIEDSGYVAIHFSMSDAFVQRNKIYSSCLTKEDGGAIYCFGKGGGAKYVNRHITENTIVNTLALNVPNGWKAQEVYAIYLDEDCQNVQVENNTVINAVNGIYLHAAKNNQIRYNKIYNTTYSGLYVKANNESEASTGNTITDNEFHFFAGCAVRLVSKNNLTNIGTINRNRYVKPTGGDIFDVNYGAEKYSTIASWNKAVGYDADSSTDATTDIPIPDPNPFKSKSFKSADDCF